MLNLSVTASVKCESTMGAGYRVYFRQRGDKTTLLFGGDKDLPICRYQQSNGNRGRFGGLDNGQSILRSTLPTIWTRRTRLQTI